MTLHRPPQLERPQAPRALRMVLATAPERTIVTSPTSSIVSRSLPSDPSCTTPFFAATLRPWNLLPAISYASSFSPIDVTLIQPPLPALPEEVVATSGTSKRRAEEVVIATDRWVKYRVPVVKSTMRIMSVDSHIASPDDGSTQAVDSSDEWWPSKVRPWSVGCWLEDAELLCEAGETWEA